MHEMSIVQALLDRVEAEAEAHAARSVAVVRIAIGSQSGVEPELVRTAYELVRGGTCCADAQLVIRHVEAAWACPACAQPLEVGELLRCPRCGVPARLAAGDEIVLEQLELEVA